MKRTHMQDALEFEARAKDAYNISDWEKCEENIILARNEMNSFTAECFGEAVWKTAIRTRLDKLTEHMNQNK